MGSLNLIKFVSQSGGPTLNDAFNDNKLLTGVLYKIEIVFG